MNAIGVVAYPGADTDPAGSARTLNQRFDSGSNSDTIFGLNVRLKAVSVGPTLVPSMRTIPATVDAQTAATVAGIVRIDGTSVGPTDTAFNRTFNPKIVSEFDPESKRWFSVRADPAGSVSAPGYATTPIAFMFYEPDLTVSVQP